jgi:hypothetical protein
MGNSDPFFYHLLIKGGNQRERANENADRDFI